MTFAIPSLEPSFLTEAREGNGTERKQKSDSNSSSPGNSQSHSSPSPLQVSISQSINWREEKVTRSALLKLWSSSPTTTTTPPAPATFGNLLEMQMYGLAETYLLNQNLWDAAQKPVLVNFSGDSHSNSRTTGRNDFTGLFQIRNP